MAYENQNESAESSSDHVISIKEFAEEIAEYLDEVASGKILTADETDGSIEYFPTAKSDDEIFGKKREPMAFDVSTINRVGKEIEEAAKRLQEHVNSPNELQREIQKIQSSLKSIQSLSRDSEGGQN